MRTLIAISFLILSSYIGFTAEQSIQKNLRVLANVVFPAIDFSDDVTLEMAVEFLDSYSDTLHVDPPVGRIFKVKLEVSKATAQKKVSIIGKNMHFHEVVGKLADAVGADVIITRDAIVIRERKKNAEQADDGVRDK